MLTTAYFARDADWGSIEPCNREDRHDWTVVGVPRDGTVAAAIALAHVGHQAKEWNFQELVRDAVSWCRQDLDILLTALGI